MDAVKDSNEQLLTVVSVVIIEELGDKDGAETDIMVGFELEEGEVVDEVVVEEPVLLLFVLVVLLLLLMVIVLCVVDLESDDAVEFVKRSPLVSGSSADCDEKLNTEPQLIVRVLQLSSSSTSSPNAESASVWVGDAEAN